MITLTEYFETDHKRLDLLLAQFKSNLENDKTRAIGLFEAFESGLRKHILWEESVLFPFFEKKSQFSHGPTHVMTNEHIEILQLVSQIQHSLTDEPNKSHVLFEELVNLLTKHNHKEENILYPLVDQNASETERSLMFMIMETGQVA
ncbi:hemerythrin domain-containing protein [Pseudoalteromonas sp. SSM20]|uniref:hemerythrin domain-containing protein n=1 Tax=Pseudoalteromonas sp. SSM20 TaxID=3139394 RepID=UPI003BAAD007